MDISPVTSMDQKNTCSEVTLCRGSSIYVGFLQMNESLTQSFMHPFIHLSIHPSPIYPPNYLSNTTLLSTYFVSNPVLQNNRH